MIYAIGIDFIDIFLLKNYVGIFIIEAIDSVQIATKIPYLTSTRNTSSSDLNCISMLDTPLINNN